MVNTERMIDNYNDEKDYNILNIVVNTEPNAQIVNIEADYNILNIVVNTEHYL